MPAQASADALYRRSERIPFIEQQGPKYGVYTDTSSGIVGVGIVGSMVVGAAPWIFEDCNYINCYTYELGDENNPTFYLEKRPGWASHDVVTSVTEVGNDLYFWQGYPTGQVLVSAFGNPATIYVDGTSVGTISGKVKFFSERLVGTTPTLCIIATDNTAWYFQRNGSVTKITDADFPANVAATTIVGNFVHLNGRTYIMTTGGAIYGSDLDSITSWSSLNVIQANTYPDEGRGLFRYKNQIVAFGTQSIEFFVDVGNPTASVLEKNQGITVKIGTMNEFTIKEFDDTIFFLGLGNSGNCSLFVLSGYNVNKIDAPIFEKYLSTEDLSNLELYMFKFGGFSWALVPGSPYTYVFNLENKRLHFWDSGNKYWGKIATDSLTGGVYSVCPQQNTSVGGTVFFLDPYVFQDNGNNYTVTWSTDVLDFKTENMKRLHKFRILADQEDSSTSVSVSWSDDQYDNFSTARTVDLGGTSTRSYLTQCGSFRRRAFRFQYTGANTLRVLGMEVDYAIGTH